MSAEIVIIGSGFASRQLVKNLRHRDNGVPIRVFAADSCDEYSKPELSHVFSLGQTAEDLSRQRAAAWAEAQNIMLHPHSRVSRIETASRRVITDAGNFLYGKLVLATGAEPIRPPVSGSELMVTLNSQRDYRQCEAAIRHAKRMLVLGGGLVGTELAMDLNRAGKEVMVVDSGPGLLCRLLPPEIAGRLQHRLLQNGVHFMFGSELSAIERDQDGLVASFSQKHQQRFDAIICAIGLRPNVALAREAGLGVQRGIVVDDALATSDPDIYALGDCAEIHGKLMPYLQPATLAAMTLAKNLTGEASKLLLPTMLIKVKTPDMPLHLAGDTANPALNWEVAFSSAGLVAKGFDDEGTLNAFVVSEDHMKLAFSMLKSVKQSGK